jgi:hypothetical protein
MLIHTFLWSGVSPGFNEELIWQTSCSLLILSLSVTWRGSILPASGSSWILLTANQGVLLEPRIAKANTQHQQMIYALCDFGNLFQIIKKQF